MPEGSRRGGQTIHSRILGGNVLECSFLELKSRTKILPLTGTNLIRRLEKKTAGGASSSWFPSAIARTSVKPDHFNPKAF